MTVVSNTTPLIGLASIQHFDLLRRIFQEIYIPQAVYDEIVVAAQERDIAKHEVSTAPWIKTIAVEDRLTVESLLDELDLGEAETIVLARELGPDWVLMDEKKGRQELERMGLPKIGTVGILLKAKQAGLLPAIRPEVEGLRQKGFSLSQAVVDAVLQQAEE